MFLLVGLGNPGDRYARTRHNAGFLVVERLAAEAGVKFGRTSGGARTARADLEGRPVMLVKPQTYMNASGPAVADLLRRRCVALTDLLVIVDDMDLPLGVLRMRPGGGSGGHRGLESIITALGTRDFSRLRLGVGRPAGDAVDHVLGTIASAERDRFEFMLTRAADAVRVFVIDGINAAMNEYNKIPET